MSKRKRTVLLIVAGALALAVLAVILFEFVFSGRIKIKLPPLPGTASSAGEYDPDLLAPGVRKIMDRHLVTSITVNGEMVDLLAISYETSPRRGFPERRRQDFLRATRYGTEGRLSDERARRIFQMGRQFDRAFRPSGTAFHASALRSVETSARRTEEPKLTEQGEQNDTDVFLRYLNRSIRTGV